MKKSEDAFTLLELIIALSIGVSLVLVVSLSVKMGFLHIQRGSAWLDENHRSKSASQFFFQQVSSMKEESIDEEVIFQGSSDKVLFVTPISLKKRYGLGLMTVLYYQEQDEQGISLNYKEKRFLPDENADKFKDENNAMFDSSDKVTMFEGCEEITFEFLGAQGSGDEVGTNTISNEWTDSWTENSLPRAIKIVMSKNGQSKEILAPVMALY